MKPYLELNTNSDDICNKSKIFDLFKNTGVFWKNRSECFKIFDHTFLNKLELYSNLEGILVFHISTSYTNAHVDGENKIYGLNFAISKSNNTGKMQWFTIKNNIHKPVIHSPSDLYHNFTPHMEYKPNEIELLDEFEIKNKLVLTRVDIPHRVICENDRLCISFRLKNTVNNWPDAVKDFQRLII